MNAKVIVIICAVLVAVIGAFQWEIRNLEVKLEKVRLGDEAIVAALEKFKSDLAAKQRADEKAKLGAAAEQDAARRKNIDAGLNALPTGSFREPVYWDAKKPEQKPNN